MNKKYSAGDTVRIIDTENESISIVVTLKYYGDKFFIYDQDGKEMLGLTQTWHIESPNEKEIKKLVADLQFTENYGRRQLAERLVHLGWRK